MEQLKQILQLKNDGIVGSPFLVRFKNRIFIHNGLLYSPGWNGAKA
jgi:hypothetical protein